MTTFLAPRAPTRPGSATLERRTKVGHVPRSSKTVPAKSVTFQDQSSPSKSSKKSGKSQSGKWWKKSGKKEAKHHDGMLHAAPPTCDSPASIRSAPPHTLPNGYHSRSPEHTLPSPAHSSLSRSSSIMESALDNVYDLYAVCNHTGSMNRGHYTAYCRNPADGHWYGFDDVNVHPVAEDQLITPGAYMLFYVRQSLLVQSPLSSSESSTSSGSTSHWTQHIPHFRIDFNDYTTPQHRLAPRTRLGSTNSAVSAPPTTGIRGISPQSSAPDSEDVFHHRHGSSPSAHSLPQYHPTLSQPSYPNSPGRYQRSYSSGYPQKQMVAKALSSPAQARVAASGRHPSLRLGKPQGYVEEDTPLRRGASFHAPRHHSVTQATDLPHNPHYPQSRPVIPSRSIPNMHNESENYPHNPALSQGPILPSRSIPNMPQEMSPRPTRRAYPQDDIYDHFAPRQGGYGRRGAGNESCV